MSSPPPRTTIGKGNSLLYSLLISAFLVWQSVDVGYDREGFYARSKEVPLPTIVACSTFIAVGLGINILDTLTALQQLAYRNSQMINTIARKQNIQPELEQPEDLERDQQHPYN